MRLGVEVDNFGRAVAYHFKGRDSSNESAWSYWSGDVQRIAAENILHLYQPEYANVNRGVSWLAPVLPTMEQLRRYRETAIKAARIGAALAVSTESKSGDPLDSNTEARVQGLDTDPDADADTSPHYYKDVSGNDVYIEDPDHALKMNQPSYPHQMFESFHSAMLKAIASGLDYPEAVLTNNWADINFSAGQLMMSDAEMRHRRLREWMKEFERWWHDPWLKQAVLSGAADIPPTRVMTAIDAIGWNGAVVPPADMQKAAIANKTAVEMGWKSRQQVCEELGLNWEEQKAKILAERKELGMPDVSPAAADKDDEESDGDKDPPKGRKK